LLNKKLLFLLFIQFLLVPVYAQEYSDNIPTIFPKDKILSEGIEYEIAEISKEYKLSKYSHITRSQGYTTTGEMFFLRVSDISDFEHVMLLDRTGHWLKAEILEKEIQQEEKLQVVEDSYIPELLLNFSHDFRTYWTQTFDIDVQSFDAHINNNIENNFFEGRLANANVTVLISTVSGETIMTLNGVTSDRGYWDASYYVPENITPPGEYVVDILLSYNGQSVSETSSMFIIGETPESGGQTPSLP